MTFKYPSRVEVDRNVLSDCLPGLAHSGIISLFLHISHLFFSCLFYDMREGYVVFLLHSNC